MSKMTIEQKWHQESKEAKSQSERLPHGKERDALVRRARQLENRLPNQSMAFIA
jgi:hypothetical protein